jgi:glycosyltransferase involved in cell wall biosynthesis
MRKKHKNMMIGTSPTGKGGVASVIQGYAQFGIFEKLNIDYYSTHVDGNILKKIFFYVYNLASIIIKLNQYSIIHIHSASFWSYRRLFLIIILSKIFHKKVVTHIHGAKFQEYYNSSIPIERKMIEFGFKISNKIVVLSPEWVEKISAFCSAEKICVIPNCVSIPSSSKDISFHDKSIKTKNILFLGRLGRRKGVYDLLRAIKILGPKPSTVKLLLCGDGDLKKIQYHINDLGLNSVVSVLGWVNGEKKNELFRKAYIYVLPSYFEGLPMSILEAMSYSLPIVATNVGGIPFAVESGKEGFLIDPNKPVMIAQAIKQLLTDEEEWKNMSSAAKEKIKGNFSMEVLYFKLKDLYDDLLN